MRIVIDLDDTICRPNHQFADVNRKYAEAEPIAAALIWLRKRHEAGDYIIIHTARRMLTAKGDARLAEELVGDVTRSWLKRHGVPHHELIFGKPYGDIYIDDKAALPWAAIPFFPEPRS